MRRRSPPNAAGAHFLRNRPALDLGRLAAPGPGDLVLDLGAGLGALTGPLAATGARVVAVEREESYAQRLRRRFATTPTVSVVTGDLLAVPLPRRDFHVVANIPFATTAALLRRLPDPPPPTMDAEVLAIRRVPLPAGTEPVCGTCCGWPPGSRNARSARCCPAGSDPINSARFTWIHANRRVPSAVLAGARSRSGSGRACRNTPDRVPGAAA